MNLNQLSLLAQVRPIPWLLTHPLSVTTSLIKLYLHLLPFKASWVQPHFTSPKILNAKLKPLKFFKKPPYPLQNSSLIYRAGVRFATLALSNLTFIKTNHTAFKVLFHLITRANWISLSVNAFYSRFHLALELLANLFYFDAQVLTLGNKLFWNETLTLNRLLLKPNSFDFTILRQKFFFFDQKLSPTSPFLFHKLSTGPIETVFVPDILTHQSNIRHFKKTHHFIIGLVPINF